jgi:hypothetical protein
MYFLLFHLCVDQKNVLFREIQLRVLLIESRHEIIILLRVDTGVLHYPVAKCSLLHCADVLTN